MRKLYKTLLFTILVTSTMFYSCETLELENLASPNGLSPNQANPDFLLNSIQLSYRISMFDFNNNSAALARIDVFRGQNYFASIPTQRLNSIWQNLYAVMIPIKSSNIIKFGGILFFCF